MPVAYLYGHARSECVPVGASDLQKQIHTYHRHGDGENALRRSTKLLFENGELLSRSSRASAEYEEGRGEQPQARRTASRARHCTGRTHLSISSVGTIGGRNG
jgi:hypothetical protein